MYSPDPFEPIYSYDNSITHELYSYACELEDMVYGDFDLNTISEDIKLFNLSYVKIGLLAFKVKTKKLYKHVCFNFKDYCEQHLNSTVWQINRVINASKVVMELIGAGFTLLPKNEAQARPLTNLDTDTLISTWSTITTCYSPQNITAKVITDCINPNTQPSKVLRVNSDLYEHIQTQAQAKDQSIEEYLANLTGLNNSTYDPASVVNEVDDVNEAETPTKPKKLTNWLKDLHHLVDEHTNQLVFFFKLVVFTPAPT
jgi:hypothetical protein